MDDRVLPLQPMELAFQPSLTELYVRFADVDMMQVVHHAAYVHWLEKIRFEFLHNIVGVTFEMLVQERLALPLTQCEVNYRRPFKFGDVAHGFVRVELFPQAKVALHYQIFNAGTGELATLGKTTHCYLKDNKLLLRTPAIFEAALQRLREIHPNAIHLAQGGR